MSQSSLGYVDPEEEDRAAALPLDTQDRASTNLKSPAFEKPAEQPDPAAPRFATPMASALDGYVPSAQSTPSEGTPLSDRSQSSSQEASRDATAPEPAVQAPRLKGADADTEQALQHFGEQPEPILPPSPGSEQLWLDATDRRQRENDAQQAGIHAFLKSRGVETETLPDGSQTIATHPDGAPVWKPATSAPFQDPESGRWVVRQRDDHGHLRDVSALDVQGAVHTDSQTGDQYVYDTNRQPVKIGTDQAIAAAKAIAHQRSFLYARENQAAAQIADLNASLAPVKDQYHALQTQPATESDGVGGKSKSVKQLENTKASLQSAIDGGTADDAVKEQYKTAADALTKFGQDHPEYEQIKATLGGAKEQMRSIDAERRKDRDTRLQLALGTTSAAVSSTLPDTRAVTGQPSTPGDADPAQVARDVAVTAGATGTTQSKALVSVLQQMRMSAHPPATVGGKPLDEMIQAASNPPVKLPPEPAPQAPAKSASTFWKNMVGTFMNAADQSGALLGEGVLRAFGATDAADEAGRDARYAKEVASGQFSPDNPYRPGGPKEGQDLKGWVDPARKDELMTGIAGAASDVPMFVAGPWAAVPSFTIKGASGAGDEAAAQGKSRSMGALKGAGQGVATLAAYAVGGPVAKGLTPAIEGAVGRGLATAGISTGVNSIISATMSSVFGGNALPQTPAEWGQRLFMDAGFGLHASIQSAKLPGHIASALNAKLTLPEQIQLSQARLQILEATTSAIESGDAGGAHVATTAENAAANLAYLNDQKAQVEKFLKAQNPKLVDAIDAKVKAAADLAKSAVDAAPIDPVESATNNARQFTDNLRKSDILQRKAGALPADHPLEERTQVNDRAAATQNALSDAHDAAVEAVPEVARKAIAATLGTKPEAIKAHFDEQPSSAFQAAHVGQQLRDLYTTPEQRTRLDSIAARVGEHGPTARFIADQHVGMKAAKDLTAIAALREVPPERAAGLQRLGLVEMENGQPVVTHDALKLLPKGLTARLATAPDAYRVKSLLGEKFHGEAAMVRAGQGQLEQALHSKALATRAPAEGTTHLVRVQFTRELPKIEEGDGIPSAESYAKFRAAKVGKPGETTFAVKARSEEEAKAIAVARVQKGAVRVTDAEVTTAEKEQARKKAEAAPKAPDPLAPNVATPAKLSDFTPAEQQFANLVANEYRRNQKYLEALGISKVELVRNSAQKSGLAVNNRALQLDASQLKRQADIFSQQGVKAKEWARAALQEEAWHAIQFQAAGADFETHYTALHSDLSPEMLAHAREVYTDFDSLPKHAQAAEVERMILQQKWNGTITEKFVASIERILAYLKGLKIESSLLRESIARVEAVREEALKRASAESRTLAEPAASSPPEGPTSSGPSQAEARSQDAEEAARAKERDQMTLFSSRAKDEEQKPEDKANTFEKALHAERQAYREEVAKRPIAQQPPRMWYEREAAEQRGVGPQELTYAEIQTYKKMWQNAVDRAIYLGKPVYAMNGEAPPKRGWVKRDDLWHPPGAESNSLSAARAKLHNEERGGPVEIGHAILDLDTPILTDLADARGHPDAESAVLVDKDGVHHYDLTGEKPLLMATSKATGDKEAIAALHDDTIPKVRNLDEIDREDFPDATKALVIRPNTGRLELVDIASEEPVASARLMPAEEDSLGAARAKTAAQKEAERLAKLRETRAGFAAETGSAPESAPEPHILTKPEGRSAINAYHHLVQKTGFPAVSIADLADQSGVPLDRLKQQLLRSQKAGSVVLSTGDWSLADEKMRTGLIEHQGQKMLRVRFVKESGDLATARAANAKVAQAIAPLRDAVKTAGAKREIAQDFDATGNKANERGVQATNHIRLPFERPIPRGETGAQAKAREAAVKMDLAAARPVVETGGNRSRMAAEIAKVNASPDAKLRDKFTPIYQHALDNIDRLNRMLAPHVKLANENYDSLKAAGIDVGKRAEYVHRVTTPPEDPNAPHLAFEMGNGNGSGNARGMLKGRSFDTMGDAIKAGYDPGDYGIHEADGRMVQNSTRIIGDKAFLDKMKQVKAPTDGKPIIGQLVKRRLANGETELKVPDGYSTVNAMGRPLVIHKMFAPLFRDLYGTSAIRNFAAGRALLKLAAAGKHGTLVFDTFHGGRILYKMAAGGGGAPIVIRDGRPVFNYHAGLSLIEYADKDLAVAVKQGEVMPEEAAYAKKHRAAFDELVKAGLNVGKVADNLMDQVKRHIPVITAMNDWLFSKLTRGAMVQTALAFHERNLARPGMSREQAARRTATEMNEYFGNLQNQGIFKSKTLQDIARLVFLAPNWTESQARYEARAYGQLGASAVDAARGKGLRAGNATRAMATGFVALLAANQVANYLSRGQSTFENEEDGHKLDAWVPGGKRGFWFNPFEIAGEYAHAAMKYTAQHENPVDVATHIASNKLSPLGRGVKEAGTGRDFAGRHFLSDTDRFRSAAVDTLPSPLPASAFFEKDPRAPIGYRVTRANGGILPSMEKQLLQSGGAKVTAAQSPRTQLFALAQPFKKEGVYADSAGEFTALRQSLDMDEPEAVKTELRWLLDRGKEPKAIAAALGIHANGISPERFTGSVAGEKEMLKSFTPAHRKLYDQAEADHQANAKKFLAIVRSPDGQQIIAEARKKAAAKK